MYIYNGTRWESLTESKAVIKIYATGPITIDDTDPNYPKISISLATPENDGLMSKEDKKKLDEATSDPNPNTLVQRDLNGNISVADPKSAYHAVNKRYIDQIMFAYTQIKPPVRIATDTDIRLFGLQTIDDVKLKDGDRVLVRAQNDPKENGIYIVRKNTWERANDYIGYATIVFVEEGKYANYGFFLKTNNGKVPVVGTDPLNFERMYIFEQQEISDGDEVFIGENEPENPNKFEIWIK